VSKRIRRTVAGQWQVGTWLSRPRPERQRLLLSMPQPCLGDRSGSPRLIG
jgi:hypothetical protein